MVSNTIIQNINRYNKEVADLHLKISIETKKEADLSTKINQIQKSLNSSNLSLSTLNSKMADIARKQTDIAKSQQKKAELQKKLTNSENNLLREKQKLAKEQEADFKKTILLEKKLAAQQNQYKASLTQIIANVGIDNKIASIPQEFDFFISHASEDKEEFVRTLYDVLVSRGYKVWFDEMTLKVGDSLMTKINEGLIHSRFGIVVLSKTFLIKNWTNYELKSLVAREMNDGSKKILPIWHGVTKDDILNFSPNLADKVALNTAILSIEEIVNELADLLPLDQ